MTDMAHQRSALTRIAEYARSLEHFHLWGTDEQIDSEFNTVCREIWGYTCDDFDDEAFSLDDHAWLDSLSRGAAYEFALANGYDLADYHNGGFVSDWWGFAWMILAEKRGLFTPEQRAAAWRKHDARLMAETNVVAVIRHR